MCWCLVLLQGAAEKSGPLNFFAIFSATVWDFNMKFWWQVTMSTVKMSTVTM